MKIIDLLNKIANGEEVPKKIKINRIIFEYQGDDYLYIEEDNTNYWLFSDPYCDKFEYLESFLKTEVEIIKEDNKIKPLLGHYTGEAFKSKVQDKINEIIDKINEDKNVQTNNTYR